MVHHPRERRTKLRAFERLCRERGLPLTVQRRVIYEAVLDGPGHPTADDVYEAVQGRLPGVSRATVYRVLETLAALRVIGKPSHLGSARRYDISTQRHHHLVCTRCERTIDLDDPTLDRLKLPNTRRLGFHIEDFSVHFSGLCQACRKESKTDRKLSAGLSTRNKLRHS